MQDVVRLKLESILRDTLTLPLLQEVKFLHFSLDYQGGRRRSADSSRLDISHKGAVGYRVSGSRIVKNHSP
jgi:hypothetical protein